uniref:Candidate secreted effector n=1 Tax=Meloidogyne incognita TaxID=6306 RepID=A0A914N0J3_MELIC
MEVHQDVDLALNLEVQEEANQAEQMEKNMLSVPFNFDLVITWLSRVWWMVHIECEWTITYMFIFIFNRKCMFA